MTKENKLTVAIETIGFDYFLNNTLLNENQEIQQHL